MLSYTDVAPGQPLKAKVVGVDEEKGFITLEVAPHVRGRVTAVHASDLGAPTALKKYKVSE